MFFNSSYCSSQCGLQGMCINIYLRSIQSPPSAPANHLKRYQQICFVCQHQKWPENYKISFSFHPINHKQQYLQSQQQIYSMYNFPTQASLGTESRVVTIQFILAEVSSLRNVVAELYCLRERDIKTILQQAQEINRLKYEVRRMQQDFNLQYFEPGAQKRFVFVEGSNPNYKLKGGYLSKSSKSNNCGSYYVHPQFNHTKSLMLVTSGQAINSYAEDRFSISVTVQNQLSLNSALGLHNFNQILTKQMHNLSQLKGNKSNYQPKDKITMTVDRQKKMVFWYVNNKLTGKQELNIDWNQDIFPYLRLEPHGFNSVEPQVII